LRIAAFSAPGDFARGAGWAPSDLRVLVAGGDRLFDFCAAFCAAFGAVILAGVRPRSADGERVIE